MSSSTGTSTTVNNDSRVTLRQRSASFAMKNSKSFDASAFASLIDEKSIEAEKTPLLEMLRLKTKKYLATSFLGKLYTNSLLVLSVLSCLQYILQTYVSGAEPEGRNILNIFSKLELCLAALFAFDWVLNLFLADHRWEQLIRFFFFLPFSSADMIQVSFLLLILLL